MENKLKGILRSGTVLATAGVIGVANLVSGCFGGDNTVNVMIDTGKAIVNFGIDLSQWEDDVDAFINTNEAAIKAACPQELDKYQKAKDEMEQKDKDGDDSGDSFQDMTADAVDLMKKAAAYDKLDSNLREEAEKLVKRYDVMYDEMKNTITKSMPDASKEEINKALDDAFKAAK